MTTYVKLETPAGVFDSEPSIELIKSIGENNSSSRLTTRIYNQAGLWKTKFVIGETVSLYADKDTNPPTTKIFGGQITQVSYEGLPNKETIIMTARDWTSLLQNNTLEPEVYTDELVEDIVTDIIEKYAPDDFTTTNVAATGKTIDRISFKQVSIFDALKRLADRAGYIFYVDEDKDVNFQPKSAVASGVTLDNTNVVRSRFREDLTSVRNRVYVYGDRFLVAAPQELFTADGAGSVFTLQNNPHNTKVQVSGVDQVGGVYLGAETTPESGIQFLVNYHDRQIVLVSGTNHGELPDSGVQVLVDYDQSRPIAKLAENRTSIDTYEARTEVIVDKNIKDPQFARDLAKTTVTLKKDPPIQGDLDVEGVVNLTPGQTVVVNLPYENVNTQTYDLLEARYTFNVKNNLSDRVLKVKVNQKLSTITDVIKDILLTQKQLQADSVDDSGPITRLLVAPGSAGMRVNIAYVRHRNIGNSFIFSHPINGLAGSPQIAINGSQILMGDQRESATIHWSGGE